jgi:hypothetical protein
MGFSECSHRELNRSPPITMRLAQKKPRGNRLFELRTIERALARPAYAPLALVLLDREVTR